MGCGLVLGLLAGLLMQPVRAADKEPSPEDYAKASQPGAEHKALEPLAGEWTYSAKLWMNPGDEPLELAGKATRKWILGGRFLHEEVENEKPIADFKGVGLMGYDKTQKKYTSMWVDSMTTSITTSLGTADKDRKVFTFHREMLDPVTGKKIKGRDVLRILGKDKHVTEMFKEVGGKEIKVMEITSVRKEK
jgi:Protein of unknown function (DUF1579)